MENISENGTGIHELLSSAYALASSQELDEAVRKIESSLGLHYGNPEIAAFLKCAQYWQDRFANLGKYASEYEKAEYLLSQWRGFPSFVSGSQIPDRPMRVFSQLVFRKALSLYESLMDTSITGVKDGDLLLRIGICYKELGEYDKALEYLDAANQIKKENAQILAELADCYSFVGELDIAKAFFREAFFINPGAIYLDGLQSGMIRRLIDKLREMGMQGAALAEWLPVYGVLFNVLNIKRELRPIEYGKLRESIYRMEMELRDSAQKNEVQLARLINRYFWLIDHYQNIRENSELIEETLLKIKVTDLDIYKMYTR